MNAKHTPGPWDNEQGNHPWIDIYVEKDGSAIAKAYGDNAESIANARLIATAPELLEALQSLTSTIEQEFPELKESLKEKGSSSSGLTASYKFAKKAIEKAEGGK